MVIILGSPKHATVIPPQGTHKLLNSAAEGLLTLVSPLWTRVEPLKEAYASTGTLQLLKAALMDRDKWARFFWRSSPPPALDTSKDYWNNARLWGQILPSRTKKALPCTERQLPKRAQGTAGAEVKWKPHWLCALSIPCNPTAKDTAQDTSCMSSSLLFSAECIFTLSFLGAGIKWKGQPRLEERKVPITHFLLGGLMASMGCLGNT